MDLNYVKFTTRIAFFSKQKAYAYAEIVYTGPMLLGILLTADVVVLTMVAGISENERDYILSNFTYAIIFSLVSSSLFSLVAPRFVADMLYEKKFETIIPSFYASYASSALMLMIGTPLYALYQALASRSLAEVVMGVLLFGELCLVWNVITYLTAIKSYKEIIKGFFLAIGVTIVSGLLSILLHQKYGIFLSVCLGNGGMMFWMVRLIHDYFPSNLKMSFEFLKWFDQFSDLAKTGYYIFMALFAHIIINWFGPISKSFDGFFRTAPVYDVPAMLSYLTNLVSTLNFVMSVGVSFYPHFRCYFNLYNEEGSLSDIQEAETQMLDVMSNELKYVFLETIASDNFHHVLRKRSLDSPTNWF